MADRDQAGAEPSHGNVHQAMPVTPSRETERPEGLAFDIEKGASLPGVPVGDQTPKNPGAAPVQEKGGGVGLSLPGEPGLREEAPGGDGVDER
jgi:hypothetical protein